MPTLDPFTSFTKAVEARLRIWFLDKKWAFHIVPSQLTVREFEQISTRTPLLAFAWTKITPPANGGRSFSGQAEFTLTIVVKNQAAGAARYFGDSQGVGLFPAAALAIAVLNGWTVKGLGTLFVTDANQTYADGLNDHSLAIATIDLKATIAFGDFLGAVDAAPDFLALSTQWDVSPAEDAPTDLIEPREGA
ncbi:hypothetical protein [Microvirga terricola]|uniref:Uncharacterized protein n=1 Tax=Microvirga terricola TaxID=2719797 RepID=A0ABX0V6M8_9HYPH|nr:hypothetical protein [Microvirga terricola]NIX75388.1 hypothetical protein [Microvirga terricola]